MLRLPKNIPQHIGLSTRLSRIFVYTQIFLKFGLRIPDLPIAFAYIPCFSGTLPIKQPKITRPATLGLMVLQKAHVTKPCIYAACSIPPKLAPFSLFSNKSGLPLTPPNYLVPSVIDLTATGVILGLMQTTQLMLRKRFMITAIIAVAVDQLTKIAVFASASTELCSLFGGFFMIEHAHNTGAVFGIGEGWNSAFALLSAAFLVMMVPFFFIAFLPQRGTYLTAIAGGLAYGGVAGNFIDRVVFGAVRDFITIGPWPTFNIADACICSGVAYFAWRVLFDPPDAKRSVQ